MSWWEWTGKKQRAGVNLGQVLSAGRNGKGNSAGLMTGRDGTVTNGISTGRDGNGQQE